MGSTPDKLRWFDSRVVSSQLAVSSRFAILQDGILFSDPTTLKDADLCYKCYCVIVKGYPDEKVAEVVKQVIGSRVARVGFEAASQLKDVKDAKAAQIENEDSEIAPGFPKKSVNSKEFGGKVCFSDVFLVDALAFLSDCCKHGY